MRTQNRRAMQPILPKYTEWLAAENDAQAAESELLAVMLASAKVPSVENLELVQAKRTKARSLLRKAMEEMKAAAESLHHRRIVTTRDTLSTRLEQVDPDYPAPAQERPGSDKAA